MTPLQTQNEKIDALLAQAFAVREVGSDTLAARLDEVCRTHRVAQLKQQKSRRLLRRGLALASVTFAVVLTVITLPKILVWRALAQMADAAENARSMHTVAWAIEADGSRRKTGEIWFQDGRWRIERPREVQIFAGAKLFTFQPRARLATWRKAEEMFAYNSSGFSIRAMATDIARWGWRDKITLSPDEQTIDGRRARVAVIETAIGKNRIVLYADPKTMLPFRYDLLRPTLDGWKISGMSTMEYNRPLSAALFEPKFPAGTRVVEAGAGREEWVRSLQKPIAILWDAKWKIPIRDVQMNEQGDVFVLYTAGRPRDLAPDAAVMMDVPNVDLTLSGDGKTEFLKTRPFARPSMGFFSESEAKAKSGRMRGVMVDGEPLQWAVWTRLEPLKPAQRDLSLRVNLGVQRTYWTMTAKPFVRQVGVTKVLTIARSTFALVPDYVRYFPSGMSEADFQNTVDETRAGALNISANGRREPLQKALALHRAVIERTEQQWRQDGNQGVQSDKWMAVAELCLELKQFEEAREALGRAEEDNRIYGHDTKRIETLKKRLQAVDSDSQSTLE